MSGGQATAESIPGAELVLIDDMGHNLPPGLRSHLADLMAKFVWRASTPECAPNTMSVS